MSWSSAATFYDQLRALVTAGMPLPRALELAGDAAGGPHRAWGRRWAAGCSGGSALAPQLTTVGEAPLAAALVAAGEASGRLGELCGEASGFFRHLVATRNLIIARLVYPVCLAHVALAAMAVPAVVGGHSPLLLLAGPGALWAAGGALALAARLASRDLLARLALQPGAAGLTWPLVGTNTCTVLHAAVAAGMLHHAALELAAPACGNRVIAGRLRTAAAGLISGSVPTMAAALGGAGLSATVVQLVANGEQAGKLEEALRQAAVASRESFRLRSEWTARIACGLFYGLTMLAAAFAVITLWSGYLGMINEAAAGVGE
jgi:type II secretory pathway component PulF